MAIIFRKTAKQSAKDSLLNALLVALVGCIFLAVFFIDKALPTIFVVCIVFAELMIAIMVAHYIKEARQYLHSNKEWRVEVTGRKLKWQSPVPEIMQSFEIERDNIKTLRHVIYKTKSGSRTRTSHRYFIDLNVGDNIQISDQISGISPYDVFQALEKHGFPLAEETSRPSQRRQEKQERRRQRRARKLMDEPAAHSNKPISV